MAGKLAPIKRNRIPISKTFDFWAYIGKSRRGTLQSQQSNRIVQAIEKIAQNLVPAKIPQLIPKIVIN